MPAQAELIVQHIGPEPRMLGEDGAQRLGHRSSLRLDRRAGKVAAEVRREGYAYHSAIIDAPFQGRNRPGTEVREG